MGRKSLDQKRVGRRRKEISERMTALEVELEMLRSEDLELSIAERVLASLSGVASDDASLSANEHDSDDDDDNTELVGRAIRPVTSQIKTVGEMAIDVLSEAGVPGMTSTEVLDAIRQRWLPTLMRTSLSPPLSRLKAKGEIELDGEYWKIREKKSGELK